MRSEAELVLHVMPDLVRDDIGLREVAGRAEALRQLVEEGEIDIDLRIARAVERPGRRARVAAGGIDRVREEHQPGWLISVDELRPHVFGRGENGRCELSYLVAGR